MRNRSQNESLNEQPVQDYMNKWMVELYGDVAGLEDTPLAFEDYSRLFTDKYGCSLTDVEDPAVQVAIRREVSHENPILAASSDFRDQYIFNQIQRATAEGHDVFAVFGSHHAFVFEQKLKENDLFI